MPEPINPSAIPGADLRPDMVDIAATEMSGIGDKVGSQATTVVTTWQRLAAHYDAPEDTTLFGVMDPVRTHGETFDANIGQVSRALHAYAQEVEPIKAELDRVRADAENFVVSIAGGVEQSTFTRAGVLRRTVAWHEDQDSLDANQALRDRVETALVKLWAAERRCANAIYDIIGFPHIEAASASNPNGYGLTDIPNDAETPWGTAVTRGKSCGEKVVGAYKSYWWDGWIVGGIWGGVQGFGSLVIGWDPNTRTVTPQAKVAAWTNLGLLVIGVATPPATRRHLATLSGPVGEVARRSDQTVTNVGKGLIAYDKWGTDPFAAAGETTFNVASILVPAGAATAPVRLSTRAAAAAVRGTAKVMKYTDPLGLTVDAVKGARLSVPAVSEAVRGLDLDIAGRGATPINLPTVERTGVTVDPPRTAVEGTPGSRLIIPESGIVPVRVATPYDHMIVGTTPSGVIIAKQPGLSSVRFSIPYADATIVVRPDGVIDVDRRLTTGRQGTPDPDPDNQTPIGLPYGERPSDGFEPVGRGPGTGSGASAVPGLTEAQGWTIILLDALQDTGENLTTEAAKDGVNQLNEARRTGRPVDLWSLPAEIREALRRLPDEVLQDLIDEGIVPEQIRDERPAPVTVGRRPA